MTSGTIGIEMRISRVVMAPGGMPVPLSTLIALKIPLVGQSVHAGFPSPADDFIEAMIDLNQVLIQNPTATFMWRAVDALWQSGFRYSKAGIITQDLVPPALRQRALFDAPDHDKAAKVMAAMDEANRRWGRATVLPAAVRVRG